MEIYIEYVIIDNLVINMLILLCTKSAMKLRAKFVFIFLSAVLGTVFAVVYPLFGLSSLALLPLKIALGLIMVAIIAKYSSFKEYIITFLLFLLFTLLLGGASIATLMLFGTSLEAIAAGGYDMIIPLGVVLLIVSLYVAIIIALAKFLNRKRDAEPFLKNVELTIGDKVLSLAAFLDSGNKLYDRKTGLPVVIISIHSLEKFYSKSDIEALMLNVPGQNKSPFKGVHLVPYSTLSGEEKKMVVFEATSLCIKNDDGEYITNKFMVGVTYKKFSGTSNYDMLLNSAVL